MKHRIVLTAYLLLLSLGAATLLGAEIKVADVKGKVGQFISVKAETTGKKVQWVAIDSGLNLFPIELLKDTKTAVVTVSSPGKYRLLAYTAEGDEPSVPAVATIEVEGTTPPAPPVPPDPTPPQPPTPPLPPAPIPVAGLRVLIVYDAAKETEMPVGQQAIIRGKKMDDYLQAKCAVGPDGKNREYRIWPSTVVLTDDILQLWQDAWKRDKKAIPWLLVSDGRSGFEGPLPASVDETIAVIEKVINATKKAKGDK